MVMKLVISKYKTWIKLFHVTSLIFVLLLYMFIEDKTLNQKELTMIKEYTIVNKKIKTV